MNETATPLPIRKWSRLRPTYRRKRTAAASTGSSPTHAHPRLSAGAVLAPGPSPRGRAAGPKELGSIDARCRAAGGPHGGPLAVVRRLPLKRSRDARYARCGAGGAAQRRHGPLGAPPESPARWVWGGMKGQDASVDVSTGAIVSECRAAPAVERLRPRGARWRPGASGAEGAADGKLGASNYQHFMCSAFSRQHEGRAHAATRRTRSLCARGTIQGLTCPSAVRERAGCGVGARSSVGLRTPACMQATPQCGLPWFLRG